MRLKVGATSPGFWCKNSIVFLAISWVTGLVAGMLFALTTQDVYASLMHTAVTGRVSIVALVVMLTFPLILSAAAVCIRMPWFILPISFIKGCSFGYIACAVVLVFGTAGWLIHFLLVFSDSCMLIPLFWFWIRHIAGDTGYLKRDLALCGAIALFLCALDYLFVSSFLTTLMNL